MFLLNVVGMGNVIEFDYDAIADDQAERYRLWRKHVYAADDARVTAPRKKRHQWIAQELLYALTVDRSDWCPTVFVIRIVGGLMNDTLAEARTTLPGQRIMRLLYPIDLFDPYTGLTPRAFSSEIAPKFAAEGEVIRARARWERIVGRT